MIRFHIFARPKIGFETIELRDDHPMAVTSPRRFVSTSRPPGSGRGAKAWRLASVEGPSMIKHMAFVTYSIADVPHATAFYRDVVGLELTKTPFGEGWIEFDAGGTTFGIADGTELGIPPGSQFGAAFEVDDVDARHASLAEKGVTVTPDGNRFALHRQNA